MFGKNEDFRKEEKINEFLVDELKVCLLIREAETVDELIVKCDELKTYIDDFFPLSPNIRNKFFDKIKILYTADSNKVDGNSLSYNDASDVITEGKVTSNASLRDHLEVVNHMEALNYLESILRRDEDIDEMKIKLIHHTILRMIDTRHAGIYRDHDISFTGSAYSPPSYQSLPEAMNEYTSFYNLNKDENIHPLFFAFIMHEKLSMIHPFTDSNGITARLIMNFILMKNGYYIVSICGDMEDKINYYNSLEMISETGDDKKFIKFMLKETIQSYLKYIAILLRLCGGIRGALYNAIKVTPSESRIIRMLEKAEYALYE
jgi:Fic family protein